MTATELVQQMFRDCSEESRPLLNGLRQQPGLGLCVAIRDGHDDVSFVWQGMSARLKLAKVVDVNEDEYHVVSCMEIDIDDTVIRANLRASTNLESDWDPSYYDVPAATRVKLALMVG